jgi:amino acid permease
MNIVIGSSIGGACIIYEIVAVLGYLTFGSKVGANIMAMYPATSLFIAFGQLAIVVLVLFSYPLQVHPCRNCLDKIVDAVLKKPQPAPTRVANGNTNATEQEEDEDADYDHGAHDEAGPLRHTLLTAAIIISGFSIAYFVNSLQIGSLLVLLYGYPY